MCAFSEQILPRVELNYLIDMNMVIETMEKNIVIATMKKVTHRPPLTVHAQAKIVPLQNVCIFRADSPTS